MTNKPQTADSSSSFPALVQEFFSHYIVDQRALSPHTLAAYRDTFKLFLAFTQKQLGILPTALKLTDFTADLVLEFLDHLEQERHNTVRSRNARLAALRAFLKFASHRDMASLHIITQALGVPMKRYERPMLGFLSREEILAVIGNSGTTWISQRDHLLLALLYNTGARVSEIIRVQVADVVIDGAACVHLHGKGRKQRSVPLWKTTVLTIKAWLRLNSQMNADSALLPNRKGQTMTRSNVKLRLNLAVQSASKHLAGLTKRKISPHIIRHTTAMHLLQSGVDISVIALWLGHESTAMTHMYVEADLAMKEVALAKLQEPDTKFQRYKAPDALMQFLETL